MLKSEGVHFVLSGKEVRGLGCSPVVNHLLDICEAPALITSATGNEESRGREGREEGRCPKRALRY